MKKNLTRFPLPLPFPLHLFLCVCVCACVDAVFAVYAAYAVDCCLLRDSCAVGNTPRLPPSSGVFPGSAAAESNIGISNP